MNYLAHAFLSFHHPEILVGNMISDFVKGNQKNAYPEAIQKGIHLHRLIDSFTDSHESTKQAKKIFSPYYRLYSGAFVDIVYDHFLANDSNEFQSDELMNLSQETYTVLRRFPGELPPVFRGMLPYMEQQNWLYNYQYRWGIQNSFGGLVRRAAYLTESTTAFKLFEQCYTDLQACYARFFPDVKQMALQHFDTMIPPAY